jgi:acetyl esterase/lipase
MRTTIGVVILTATVAGRSASAQPRIEKNIVYGMHSGSALLLDIHRPEKPNGYGVIHVGGSGWHASPAYDALPLKESQIGIWGPPLLRAGYTVFSINHRAAPAFRYPAAVEDVQRAVRFVRHNARRLGVDPTRLGGMGGSSGAHLLGLVAMLRAPGITDDPDPVNREPATLETVVLRAGKFDMARRPVPGATASFMGLIPNNAAAQKVYAAASPIVHVSPGAPPVLLLHGDSDDVVPFEESVAMEKALRAANVAVKLVRIPGGEHGEDFGAQGKPDPSWPDYFGEMVAWFDQHLKMVTTGGASAAPRSGRD